MKKKIKYIVATILLASCGYATPSNFSTNKIVITSIESISTCDCFYYGYGSPKGILTFTDSDFRIEDTCGKFQINDTLNFVKQ